jgi:lipoprotein-anchoring transpeptidase ErfK/SrfK
MRAKNTWVGVILAVVLCVPAQPWTKHYARRLRRTEPGARAELKADEVNDADRTPVLIQGARGAAVVRAQILLDRQHFSCGEIDADFGSNLAKAVTAFQNARNLPATSTVDARTWAVLNQDTAPAITTYEIAPQDTAGPFTKIPSDMMQKAMLPALGYESAQEALGERFHASPKLLAALNPGIPLDTAGEQIYVPNVNVPAPGPAARVVVSKSESSVAALDRDGRVLAWYAATIGSEHDPLPLGNWKINGVERNPQFHYDPDLFWDANTGDQKTVIQPGPNNPVGVVWIALSKEHYGIHGSPEPSRIGHTESHGCIRLTNWDAMELAGMVKPGTPATLRE